MSILASVKNQDHVLYAYQNSSQMLDSASLFLKRGLDNNESLMFITDKFSKEEICSELTKRWNVNVYDLQAKKHLIITTAKEWYFPDGKLDTERMLSLWSKVSNEAVSNGKNGLRVFADAEEFFDNSLESYLHDYECHLEQTFGLPLTAVCAYDVSRIDQYSSDDFQKLLDHHIVSVTH